MYSSVLSFIPRPHQDTSCESTYGKGKTIYKQKELSKGFYLLKSGTVKLQRVLPSGESTIIRIISPGQIFGEKTFKEDRNVLNSSFAIALQDNTEIEKIACISTLPEQWIQQIMNHLAQDAKENLARYERVISMESETRIRYYMKDLAQRIGVKYGDETLLKINLTHQEWAKYTDTSRQTVTQTFSKLKKQGQITYSRNRILFRNLDTF
ncbi:Crp/Fnr family transcriptional regulator [Algoriphagus sediminis]|uniref:Crp/Fnr family transcriptional regulator n=1 Tax=Algoriphagus sediminis TaxID=3057113 RepID=A0ABT7Y9R7_9BACT|nr:Crp/Fnr family transcriptional regulator [Algoriphagus sediminis]MDN3203245.1 Crp/Fnr family transcriptional regulator [Algoriphagus sediminis]